MDFTRQESSMKTESSIEVSREWSNVLTHYHQLQKLLSTCNTEARNSWAIIDKVRRSASTVTLELSDLEKELSNDITLLTNDAAQQKSDFQYVKTSRQESFTSLNHSSESNTKTAEITKSKTQRLISPLLKHQKNCLRNKVTNNLHDLTESSFKGSDDCNRCDKRHELFNNNHLKKLRQQYLEKRENAPPKNDNLFTKMINNCRPLGSTTDIPNISKTSKIQLLKKQTLNKLSTETQISNVYYNFVKKSKSVDDLSSDSSVKEKSHLDQIKCILNNYNKKKLQIKSLSETHIHPARCYFPKFYNKQRIICRHKPKYRVTYDDEGVAYKERCCTRCKRIITKQQCEESKAPKCYEDGSESTEDSNSVCEEPNKDQDCQTECDPDCSTKLYCSNSGIRNDFNDLSPQKNSSINIKAFTLQPEKENKFTSYERDVKEPILSCEDNCKDFKLDELSGGFEQTNMDFHDDNKEIWTSATHHEIINNESKTKTDEIEFQNVQTASSNIYTVDLDDMTWTRMYTIPFDRMEHNFVSPNKYSNNVKEEKIKMDSIRICSQILASRTQKDKESNCSNDKRKLSKEEDVSFDRLARNELEIEKPKRCSEETNDTQKTSEKQRIGSLSITKVKNEESAITELELIEEKKEPGLKLGLPTLYKDENVREDEKQPSKTTQEQASEQKSTLERTDNKILKRESSEDMYDIIAELNKLSKKGKRIYNKKSKPVKPKFFSESPESEILKRKRINRIRHSSSASNRIIMEKQPIKKTRESTAFESNDESDEPRKIKKLESKYSQATGKRKSTQKEIGVQCDLIFKHNSPKQRKSNEITKNKSTTTKKIKKKTILKNKPKVLSPSPIKNILNNKQKPEYISNIPRPIKRKVDENEVNDKTLLWFKTRGIVKETFNYVALTQRISQTKTSSRRYPKIGSCKAPRKPCQPPKIASCKPPRKPCQPPKIASCKPPRKPCQSKTQDAWKCARSGEQIVLTDRKSICVGGREIKCIRSEEFKSKCKVPVPKTKVSCVSFSKSPSDGRTRDLPCSSKLEKIPKGYVSPRPKLSKSGSDLRIIEIRLSRGSESACSEGKIRNSTCKPEIIPENYRGTTPESSQERELSKSCSDLKVKTTRLRGSTGAWPEGRTRDCTCFSKPEKIPENRCHKCVNLSKSCSAHKITAIRLSRSSEGACSGGQTRNSTCFSKTGNIPENRCHKCVNLSKSCSDHKITAIRLSRGSEGACSRGENKNSTCFSKPENIPENRCHKCVNLAKSCSDHKITAIRLSRGSEGACSRGETRNSTCFSKPENIPENRCHKCVNLSKSCSAHNVTTIRLSRGSEGVCTEGKPRPENMSENPCHKCGNLSKSCSDHKVTAIRLSRSSSAVCSEGKARNSTCKLEKFTDNYRGQTPEKLSKSCSDLEVTKIRLSRGSTVACSEGKTRNSTCFSKTDKIPDSRCHKCVNLSKSCSDHHVTAIRLSRETEGACSEGKTRNSTCKLKKVPENYRGQTPEKFSKRSSDHKITAVKLSPSSTGPCSEGKTRNSTCFSKPDKIPDSGCHKCANLSKSCSDHHGTAIRLSRETEGACSEGKTRNSTCKLKKVPENYRGQTPEKFSKRSSDHKITAVKSPSSIGACSEGKTRNSTCFSKPEKIPENRCHKCLNLSKCCSDHKIEEHRLSPGSTSVCLKDKTRNSTSKLETIFENYRGQTPEKLSISSSDRKVTAMRLSRGLIGAWPEGKTPASTCFSKPEKIPENRCHKCVNLSKCCSNHKIDEHRLSPDSTSVCSKHKTRNSTSKLEKIPETYRGQTPEKLSKSSSDHKATAMRLSRGSIGAWLEGRTRDCTCFSKPEKIPENRCHKCLNLSKCCSDHKIEEYRLSRGSTSVCLKEKTQNSTSKPEKIPENYRGQTPEKLFKSSSDRNVTALRLSRGSISAWPESKIRTSTCFSCHKCLNLSKCCSDHKIEARRLSRGSTGPCLKDQTRNSTCKLEKIPENYRGQTPEKLSKSSSDHKVAAIRLSRGSTGACLEGKSRNSTCFSKPENRCDKCLDLSKNCSDHKIVALRLSRSSSGACSEGKARNSTCKHEKYPENYRGQTPEKLSKSCSDHKIEANRLSRGSTSVCSDGKTRNSTCFAKPENFLENRCHKCLNLTKSCSDHKISAHRLPRGSSGRCPDIKCPQNIATCHRAKRRSCEQVVITCEEEEPHFPPCNPCICPVKTKGLYKENRLSLESFDCNIISDKLRKKKLSAAKCHTFNLKADTCDCSNACQEKCPSSEKQFNSNAITNVCDKITSPGIYSVNSMESLSEITSDNTSEYKENDEKTLKSGDAVEYNFRCVCHDKPKIQDLCDSFHNSTICSVDEEESCESIIDWEEETEEISRNFYDLKTTKSINKTENKTQKSFFYQNVQKSVFSQSKKNSLNNDSQIEDLLTNNAREVIGLLTSSLIGEKKLTRGTKHQWSACSKVPLDTQKQYISKPKLTNNKTNKRTKKTRDLGQQISNQISAAPSLSSNIQSNPEPNEAKNHITRTKQKSIKNEQYEKQITQEAKKTDKNKRTSRKPKEEKKRTKVPKFAMWTLPDQRVQKEEMALKHFELLKTHESNNSMKLEKVSRNFAKWTLPDQRTSLLTKSLNPYSKKNINSKSKSCPTSIQTSEYETDKSQKYVKDICLQHGSAKKLRESFFERKSPSRFNEYQLMPVLVERNKSFPQMRTKSRICKNSEIFLYYCNNQSQDSKRCKSKIESYVKSVDDCIKINNDFLSGIKPLNASINKVHSCPAEKALMLKLKQKRENKPEIIVTVEVQSDNINFIPNENRDESKFESEPLGSSQDSQNSNTDLNQNLHVQKAECKINDLYVMPTYLSKRHRNQWIKYQTKKLKLKNPKEKSKKSPLIDKKKKDSKTKRASKMLYKSESDESDESIKCKIKIDNIEKKLEFRDLQKFPGLKFPCETIETESYNDLRINENQAEKGTDNPFTMDETTQTNQQSRTSTQIKSRTVPKNSPKCSSNSCAHVGLPESESEKSVLNYTKINSNRMLDMPCIELEDDSEIITRSATPNSSYNPNEQKFNKLELSYLNKVKKKLDQIRAKSFKSHNKSEHKISQRQSMKSIMDILSNILSPPLPEKEDDEVKSIDKDDINKIECVPEKTISSKNKIPELKDDVKKESKELLPTHVRRNKTSIRIKQRTPKIQTPTDTSNMSTPKKNKITKEIKDSDKTIEEDSKCNKCTSKFIKEVNKKKCVEFQPENSVRTLKNSSCSCQIDKPKSPKAILKNPSTKFRNQFSSIPDIGDKDDDKLIRNVESKAKSLNLKQIIKKSKVDDFYNMESVKKFMSVKQKKKRVSEILDTNIDLSQNEIRSKLKPQISNTKLNSTKTKFAVKGKENKVQNKCRQVPIDKLKPQINKSNVELNSTKAPSDKLENQRKQMAINENIDEKLYVSRGISVCIESKDNLKVIKSLINLRKSSSPSVKSKRIPQEMANKKIHLKEIKDPNKQNDSFTEFRIINKINQPKNRSRSLPNSFKDQRNQSHSKAVSSKKLRDIKNFKILEVNQEPVREKKFTFKNKKNIQEQKQNNLNIDKSKLKELNDLLDKRTPWLKSLKTFEKMKDEIKRPNSSKNKEICTCESDDYIVKRSSSRKITLEKASVYKQRFNSKKLTNKFQKSSQNCSTYSKITQVGEKLSYEQEIWKRDENDDLYDKSENIFDKIAKLNGTSQNTGNTTWTNKSISNLTYTASNIKNMNSTKNNLHIEYEIKYKNENKMDVHVLETPGKWQMTPSMEEFMNQRKNNFISKNKETLNNTAHKINKIKLPCKSRKDFVVMQLKTQKVHRFGSTSYKNLLSTIAKSEEPYISSGSKIKRKKRHEKFINKCNADGDNVPNNCDRFDSYFNTLSEISSLPPNKKHLTKLEEYIKALKKLTKKLKIHLITVKIALDRDILLPKTDQNEEIHQKDKSYHNLAVNQKEDVFNTLIHIHQELNNLKVKINQTKFIDFKNGAFNNMIQNKAEQERLIKINQFELSKMKSIEKQIAMLDKDILNQINLKYLSNDKLCLNEEALVQIKQEKLAETKIRLNAKLNEIHKLILYQVHNQSHKNKGNTNSEIRLRKKLEHIGEVLKNELANINILIKENKED